jgi:hypothetical protein
MKKHLLPALCLLMVLLIVSFCKKVNDRNANLLGKWKGKEWLIKGKDSGMDASVVHFEFSDDGNYTAQKGDGYSEIGIWRTDREKLYTTAQGKEEIVVRLLKYDGQLLSFEMNRGGQIEVLTLAKE